jgi:ChrB-like protein
MAEARRQPEWALLAYRLPREPSTPRIKLWRRLRRLGALQLVDGLVALPLDARTREQFEWLAEDILEKGGEASVWTGHLTEAGKERALVQRMADASAAEYRTVIDAAIAARRKGVDRRTLERLRRALRDIRSRDFFTPPEREQAEQVVEELAATVRTTA